jgi:DNA-binding GntR family transcriptional regulator
VTQDEATVLVEAEHGKSGIAELYARLRALILNGVYSPGMLLPQRELAQSLGVSRTPLREVLRILEAEGLITAGRYQRSQVAPLDPEALDALYASRIQLETLGIALTIPHLQQEDLDALESTLAEMREVRDIDAWEQPHHRFHRLLVVHAGQHLCASITSYAERSERYVRIYGRIEPEAYAASMYDHEQMVQACRERNEEKAMLLLARHLTRTALTVLAQIAPEHEPVAVRKALHLMRADQTISEEGARFSGEQKPKRALKTK